MTKEVTIGIPRALHYYYSGDLWLDFFRALNVLVVLSPETNREIIRKGVALSVDEACFSSKVYLGHVDWLVGKCDYIFVPRYENCGIREDYCPRLFGIYDVVRHTFPDAKLLHADVNYMFRKRESDAFVKLGAELGFDAQTSLSAFNSAVEFAKNKKRQQADEQTAKLQSDKIKVMIVSHGYNSHDAYIGKEILKFFERENIDVIFADRVTKPDTKSKTQEIFGNRIYWTVNNELYGGTELLQDKVDGIVLLTTFPCGPDSIFNEMIIRRITEKPILSLVIDELDANAGILTRLESFVDVLVARKGGNNE